MKNIALVAASILTMSLSVGTSPVLANTVQNESSNSIAKLTSTEYFMANKSGVYISNNSGKTWRQVYSSKEPVLGIQAVQSSNNKYVKNVVAYTKDYLLVSTNGTTFQRENVDKNANIQGISLLKDASIWVIDNGVVWVSGGFDGSLTRTSMTHAVSISALDDNAAFVSTNHDVYKTIDHGSHWSKSLITKLANLPWKSSVQANQNHVAVLYYDGEEGMSQSAYILYESNNYGKTWNPVLYEGYFQGDYGVQVKNSINAGARAESFTLNSDGSILFYGFDNSTNKTKATKVNG